MEAANIEMDYDGEDIPQEEHLRALNLQERHNERHEIFKSRDQHLLSLGLVGIDERSKSRNQVITSLGRLVLRRMQ